MKKVLLPLIVFVFVCSAQDRPAQTDTTTRSAGFLNGRFWRLLAPPAKAAALMTYRDGFVLGDITAKRSDRTMEEDVKPFFPENLTWDEIRTSVDTFYEVPENRPIPIPMALQVVVMQSDGLEKSQIDKTIAEFRRAASGK